MGKVKDGKGVHDPRVPHPVTGKLMSPYEMKKRGFQLPPSTVRFGTCIAPKSAEIGV